MTFDRLFGIIPLGIGLTLLGFLWLAPFGAFHSPPLFFRVFGSFVALFFVLIGAKVVSGRIHDPRRLQEFADQLQFRPPDSSVAADSPGNVSYRCSACGAPLSEDAEVSPHGDVKCSHCNRWFNIHSTTT